MAAHFCHRLFARLGRNTWNRLGYHLIIIRHGELNTELSIVIQTGIIISVDVVLAVVAIILSIRTTLKAQPTKYGF